jgi:HKD family nuclease
VEIEIIGPAPNVQNLNPIGQRLAQLLKNANPAKCRVTMLVAYVNETFFDFIGQSFEIFITSGGDLQVIVGIDSRGTSRKALETLLNLLGSGRLYVYHNPGDGTFHPKMFIIRDDKKASVFVGSSNLTGGGLSNNFEINVEIRLNRANKTDNALLTAFEEIIAKAIGSPSCLNLDMKILDEIDKAGALRKQSKKQEVSIDESVSSALSALFGRTKQKHLRTSKTGGKLPLSAGAKGKTFIMSLVNNDISGKRWDPYFLIPLAARDQNPKFWGWPKKFSEKRIKGRPERRFVNKIQIGNKITTENGRLAYYAGVDEFRFKSDTIYNLGKSFAGSFVLIFWSKDQTGVDVANVELARSGSAKHKRILTLNLQKAGSLNKVFTYV